LRNKKNNFLNQNAKTVDRFIFWVARDAMLSLVVGLPGVRQDHSPKSHLKIEIIHRIASRQHCTFYRHSHFQSCAERNPPRGLNAVPIVTIDGSRATFLAPSAS
jgi:hypothetical protein